MYYKMKVIRDALKQNKEILYTDGDVVFVGADQYLDNLSIVIYWQLRTLM